MRVLYRTMSVAVRPRYDLNTVRSDLGIGDSISWLLHDKDHLLSDLKLRPTAFLAFARTEARHDGHSGQKMEARGTLFKRRTSGRSHSRHKHLQTSDQAFYKHFQETPCAGPQFDKVSPKCKHSLRVLQMFYLRSGLSRSLSFA